MDQITDIFADVPSNTIDKSLLDGDGYLLVDLLAECEITSSKGEARRLIKEGGVYVNNERVDKDINIKIDKQDFIDGRVLILRKGKKRYHLIQI